MYKFKKITIIGMAILLTISGWIWFGLHPKDIFPNAVILVSKKDFAASESVKIKINLGEKSRSSGFLIKKAEAGEELNIDSQLLFNSETPIDTKIDTEQLSADEIGLTIYPPESNFKPGRYTIKSVVEKDGSYRELTQDFNWGVLAINVDKSIYRSNETAKIFFGVLDENGSTLCNAGLKLVITKPDGGEDNLLTEDASIQYGKECFGNNVTDQPDYYAEYKLGGKGTYQMVLEATTENGKYSIGDYFEVNDDVPFEIERSGPTRINPTAAYEVKIKVTVNEKFSGRITEVVPSSFKLTDLSSGTMYDDPNGVPRRTLSWDVELTKNETVLLEYKFDAPDVSPEFYLLGPIQLTEDGQGVFIESRYWQIASDLVDRPIFFWDPADGALPSGWSCISCSGGAMENLAPVGSATYGGTGGSSTHLHTNTATVNASSGENRSGTDQPANTVDHTHTATATFTNESNRPKFATLMMIKADSAPSSIPQNVIAMFNATPPAGWTTYSTINDRIVLASGSGAGPVTGGSDTNSHAVSYSSLTAAVGAATERNTTGTTAAAASHTHTAPSNDTSNTISIVPKHVSVILAKANVVGTVFDNTLAMFDSAPNSNEWTVRSGASGPFENAFIEASTSYSAVTSNGGGSTHTHSNITSGNSSAASATNVDGTGNGVASGDHVHTISVSSIQTTDHRMPYKGVIIAEKTVQADISGNAYADEATTAWVPCDGVTANISLVINGGTAQTTSCNDTTGFYQFIDVTVATNNPVSIFFNATDSGVAATVAADSTSNITLNPRKNRVWVKTETGISSITNSNFDHCDSVSPAGCANVPYVVTSGALTVEDGVELHIESGKTFAPGGNVSAPNLHVVGTYSGVVGGSETLTLSGSGTGACTTDPGTIRPLCVDGGTFTASEETKFTGTSTSTVEATTYDDFHIAGTGPFQTMSGTVTVNDEFEVNPSSTVTLATNNSALAVTGVASISGTFTSGTGTKTFSGDFTLRNGGTYTGATSSATTRFRGSAVALNSSSTWTENSEAITFDRGGGNSTSWTDSNSTKQDMGVVAIAANGGNTTVNLGSSVKASAVHINSSQVLSANGSNTLTLLANGTPLNVNGAFTPSTGTVEYLPDATTGVTLASISYNNLTLNKASNTFTADGNITISGSGTPFTIIAGTFDAGTFVFTYDSTSATNITPTTYYDLTLTPSGAGGPTYTLGTDTSQTITVSNDMTVGGANAVTVTANTHDPTLDVNRDFTIDTGDTFTASNTGTFTIARNWTNGGTFNNSSGTVTLDTTTTATLAGATTFQTFNVTTAGKTVQFTEAQVFTFAGTLTVTGADGNQIHIHSTTTTQWKLNLTGTAAVTYAHIDNSGCETGTSVVTLDSTSTNGGGNDTTCWAFPPNPTKARFKGGIRLKGGVRL